MIWNIVDRREREYRWKCINAIVEPTWHDNSAKDADQADSWPDEFEYDERESISLFEAINWAGSLPYPVTLYLYDEGKGTNVVRVPKATALD